MVGVWCPNPRSLFSYQYLQRFEQHSPAKPEAANAELKKEKAVWLELKTAVQNEDYAKAATLKKQLSNSFSARQTKIKAIEAQIDAAVKAEDYAKAATLKKELEIVKSGKAPAPKTNSSTNSGTSIVKKDKKKKMRPFHCYQ